MSQPSPPARLARATGYWIGALLLYAADTYDRLEATDPLHFGTLLGLLGAAGGYALVDLLTALIGALS